MKEFNLEEIRDRLTLLPLDKLELNEGQLDGVPENPRDCTEDKFEELKKSLSEDSEMLEYKCLYVYPLGNGKHIIIGGNMRCLAMRDLGFVEAPCIVIPQETTVEKLRKLAIIDNTNFGKWNWDMLANEWDAKNLQSWGVDLPMWTDNDIEEPDGKLSTSMKDKDIAELRIKLDSETYASVVECLETFDEDLAVAIVKALGV